MVAPLNPEVTISEFMAAVSENNLVTMGQLWGTKDGPAGERMDRVQLEQRLTIMRSYLMHERYEVQVVPPGRMLPTSDRERAYEVRLFRNGCTPVVPFTLVQLDGGWLVRSVDLTQAGNPARNCTVPRAEPAPEKLR